MSSGILFASTNKGKCREAQEKGRSANITIVSVDEILEECRLPEPPVVAENADTYVGNARLKSKAYSQWAQMSALADDSGLEVTALNGDPGLFTARYAGPGCTPQDNIEKLLHVLRNETDRRAVFRCALSLCRFPDEYLEVEATLPGTIAQEASGGGGFGYDPIFIPDGYDVTLAELKHCKEPIKTHRIKALELLFQKMIG